MCTRRYEFPEKKKDIFLLLRFNVRHLRTFLQKMHYAKLGRSSVGNSVLIYQEECIRDLISFANHNERGNSQGSMSLSTFATILCIMIKCRSNCKVLDRWLRNKIA